MLLKRNFTFAIIVVVFVATLTATFNCHQPKKDPYHPFLYTQEFKTLQRSEQISKCATCHKQEYDNEMLGPHANAYKMLLAHQAFVNSAKYDSKLYTHRVNTHLEHCADCHSSQNLYETILNDSIGDIDTIVQKMIAPTLPWKRVDTKSRMTGVDCFTCHYEAGALVLHTNIEKDKNAVHAKTIEGVAKNNMSCYPCHFDVLKVFDVDLAVKRAGSLSCVNCHQEYNSQSKGTHYYYWRHDASNKVNKNLLSMLDDFHFQKSQATGKAEVEWKNTSMPHTLPIATEMIFHFEVLDKDSHLLGSNFIRVNRKREFDKEMYEELEKNYLGGTVGDDVPLQSNTVKRSIDVKRLTNAYYFKVSMVNKAQFWFPDSVGEVIASKYYLVK